MTKARTIANLGTGFVNIQDTGTAGTKVASGTTFTHAQGVDMIAVRAGTR